MAKEIALQELVRGFLRTTRLGPTELGRLAADPETGKPMTPNTIRTVTEGGPYNADTEARLRRAIAQYVVDVNAFAEDADVGEETVERIARRAGRK